MQHTAFRAACVAAGAAIMFAVAPNAQATIVFQEDFSQSVPGTYGVGPIPAVTQFGVTGGNIDIIGVLNGSFFTCVAKPAGNCLDLIGNVGFGEITSFSTINLIAGHTYTISYTSILQGFPLGPTPTEDYKVTLGSNSFIETVSPTITPVSISFVEGATQLGAFLDFTSITNIDNVHGPVLSDIMVTDTLNVGVPGPIAGAGIPGVMLAGGALLGWRRCRKTGGRNDRKKRVSSRLGCRRSRT